MSTDMFAITSKSEAWATAFVVLYDIGFACATHHSFNSCGQLLSTFAYFGKLAPCFAEVLDRSFEHCVVVLYQMSCTVHVIDSICHRILAPICCFLQYFNHTIKLSKYSTNNPNSGSNP